VGISITPDLTDSINSMIDFLEENQELQDKVRLDRVLTFGRPIKQIESYLNSIIKKDPILVKQLDRVCFSTYTNNPINIALLAPSSDGKTYAVVEVSKLFPKEDIILVGRLSPTALIHQNGFLIDEDGNNIEDALYTLGEKILVSEKQEKKELEKERADLIKSSRMCVDLKNKILIFLDNPHSATFEMLKPIMSHDNKEILYMTTKGDGSLNVKKSVIRNWPAMIFCSAKNEEKNEVWEEIKTRVFVTSPNSDISKYKEANKLTSKKMSRPSWAKGLYEDADAEKWAKTFVLELKTRLKALCNGDNNPIINPFDEKITELFPHTEGVSMRHLGRLMAFINLETFINSEFNPILAFKKKDGKGIKSVFTTIDDIDSACKVLKNISTVPPEKIKFIDKVFKPLVAEKLDGEDGVKSSELAEKYTAVFGKPISIKQVSENYLIHLVDAGILSVEENPKNKSQNLYSVSSSVTIHSLEKLKSKLIDISTHDSSYIDSCLKELEEVSTEFRKSELIFYHREKVLDQDNLKKILLGKSQNQSTPKGESL